MNASDNAVGSRKPLKGRQMLFSILKIGLLAYVGLVVVSCLAQRKLMYPASRRMDASPGDYGWRHDEVTAPVDGHETHGWYIHAEGSRGTVLISHGNAGNISHRLETVAIFRRLGFDVLLYDYGGYGNSTGKPSEGRCYADVRAMWRYLTESRAIPAERIVLFGRSLGGGVSAQLATEVAPAGLILESTFLSAPRLAQEIYWFLPAKYLLWDKFDTAGKVARIESPVLIVHSPEDDIVPYHHGRDLFELAPEPKAFLEIHGGHNEGYFVSGPIYENGLKRFLDSLFAEEDSAAGQSEA